MKPILFLTSIDHSCVDWIVFVHNRSAQGPVRIQYLELDKSGQPMTKIRGLRCPAEFITPIPKPKRKKTPRQKELDLSDGEDFVVDAQQYAHTQLINELRRLVDDWRTPLDLHP